MNEAPPPVIPGYQFRERLGRGGFSDVYLYEQALPRRQVAIKVLRIDTLDERQRQAFVTEANTMAQLADHPNIVSVLAADMTSDGRPYLVMSYYPGEDLGHRVARQPLPLAEVLRTGIMLSCAVESAHRMHVLHRDIKPANVLIGRSGAPGLTDFGIAGNMQTLHLEEEVGVSIPWCAPEVLEGRSNGSAAADVYSLGATLWNLLVGRSPFRVTDGDNSQAALINRVLRSPASTTGLDVPQTLDRLLQRCLAKDPAHRPASALELARDLQLIEVQQGLTATQLVVIDPLAALERHPVSPPPEASDSTAAKGPAYLRPGPQTVARPHSTSGPAVLSPPTSSPSGWTAGRVALVAVVVLMAVAVGGWLATRGGDEEAPPVGPATTSAGPILDEIPNPPDIGDPKKEAGRWVFTWEPVEGAAGYEYQPIDSESTIPLDRPTFSVKAGRGKRCYLVFALNSSSQRSGESRVCTPN